MTKHTATPWQLKENARLERSINDEYSGTIENDSDEIVYAGPLKFWSLKSKANAAFIVKACNERANLIEALENFMGCIANDGTKCTPNDSDFEFARAVLAKATEDG